MSISWVAGAVRSRALVRRRLGRAGARDLARHDDLAQALADLSSTPYGRDVHPGQTLAEAQHAVAATLLWHLRVLAGWLPRTGADTVRLLAAGFEIANLDEHVRTLQGLPAEPAYALGSLDSAWSRLSKAGSLPQVRDVLGSSVWGDPGEPTPWSISTGVRLSWALRLASRLPEAAAWARAATAVYVARLVVLEGRRLPDTVERRTSAMLGPGFVARLRAAPTDLTALAATLSTDTRWVMDGIRGPEDLWRAEAHWWDRLDRDGHALLHRPGFDRAAAVGAVAVLAADAWRVRAALEAVARGSDPAQLDIVLMVPADVVA